MAASTQATILLTLPKDILVLLPSYLRDIEDFMNLASTCRTLRSVLYAAVSPVTLLRLSAAASRTFFRPSPELLIAAVARQLGQWASKSEANAVTFAGECKAGMDGLLSLALGRAHCGITLARIRELYELRMSTINPVVDLIDRCVGVQWYAQPNFWSGGVDDAYTIQADPPETFFHLLIYGELFGPSILEYIRTGQLPAFATPKYRLEFAKYCIPDYNCFESLRQRIEIANGVEKPVIEEIGPYKDFDRKARNHKYRTEERNWRDFQHQMALIHTLQSTRFNRAVNLIRRQAGEDFDELVEPYDDEVRTWKQALWEDCFLLQGWESLEPLALCGLGEYGKGDAPLPEEKKQELRELRRVIEGMQNEPPTYTVRGAFHAYTHHQRDEKTYVWPDLMGDLHCMGQM